MQPQRPRLPQFTRDGFEAGYSPRSPSRKTVILSQKSPDLSGISTIGLKGGSSHRKAARAGSAAARSPPRMASLPAARGQSRGMAEPSGEDRSGGVDAGNSYGDFSSSYQGALTGLDRNRAFTMFDALLDTGDTQVEGSFMDLDMTTTAIPKEFHV